MKRSKDVIFGHIGKEREKYRIIVKSNKPKLAYILWRKTLCWLWRLCPSLLESSEVQTRTLIVQTPDKYLTVKHHIVQKLY